MAEDRVCRNGYSGYKVSAGDTIDRVDPNIDPKSFYEQYVAKRKPCIIVGALGDKDWKAGDRWVNIEYLKENAGHVELDVERRESASDQYGQNKKVRMSFEELLNKLQQGSNRYYLTTQELNVDRKTGVVQLYASPVSELIGDLPLRPAILGTLVPQQINLWLGNSVEGSTTGLHHDFHDNTYILLKGRKRFTLYSPADADRMYLRGQVAQVHPNGRFVYAGMPETRADGLEVGSRVHVADRMALIEADIQRLENLGRKAEEKGDEDETARIAGLLEAAEEELDALLAETVELNENDSDMDDGKDVDLNEYMDGSEDEAGAQDQSGSESEDEGDAETGRNAGNSSSAGSADQYGGEPLSFSLAGSVTTDGETLRKNFPKILEAAQLVADLKEGEMLYLPSGWFHEVQSFSSAGGQDTGLHMAVNYWYHPPDTLDYGAPYADPIWERAWARTHGEDAGAKARRVA